VDFGCYRVTSKEDVMYLNLGAVAYDVHDLEKSKVWYAEVFGTAPSTDRPDGVTFTIGLQTVLLNPVDAAPSGGGSVAYWMVSDIRAELTRLLALGAVLHSELEEIRPGILSAAVKDPFGNVIGIGGMSGKPDNRAIEDKPSRTALWTTMMRAFATGEAQSEIRGPDCFAEIFLPKDQFEAIRDVTGRAATKAKFFIVGVYEYVMARTSLFDGFFLQALDRGIDQVVLLGAGYDSRPYRFADRLGAVRLFELDIDPTQRHKRRCLAEAGVAIPPQVTFVAINFNTQAIGDVLNAAGFDPCKRTPFSLGGSDLLSGAGSGGCDA
jgi:predicted enzyme related to lactoylglutathione lyase